MHATTVPSLTASEAFIKVTDGLSLASELQIVVTHSLEIVEYSLMPAVQCSAVQYSALQFSAVQGMREKTAPGRTMMQRTMRDTDIETSHWWLQRW